MPNTDKLNLICAGFPRCGTTALAKYFEEFSNAKVLRDPNTGAYEYNGFSDGDIDEYYNSELISADHIFHKFSGYTYMNSISTLFRLALEVRKNTALLFMLGNQYDRLRSWHAFHRSKAVSGTDKSHFTYANREFYANCTLREYYNEFAIKRIDYLEALKKIVYTAEARNVFVVKQEDLRQHPDKVLRLLSNQLGFEVYPITKQLIINSTVLEPGITLAADPILGKELNELHSHTISWAKENNLLVDIANIAIGEIDKSKVQPTIKLSAEVFKPVKIHCVNTNSLNTAIVIGNGPSASLVDFEAIKKLSMPTCGMNSAYRLWERIGFRPTYYICMDSVVIKSHAPAISRLIDEGCIQKFFLRNEFLDLYPRYLNHPRIIWFDDIRSSENPLFTTNWITTGSWSLRWMLDLGYKLIATIGIDANYQEILRESTKVGKFELEINSTPKYNPNYFFDDYQQAGDEYNIPNDPQYVAKHGTTVHADAVVKVREDMDSLKLKSQIFDLSPLSEHNAFPKLPIANYLNSQQVSLTTSFCLFEGKEDEARLNADALCFNLSQARISKINLLFEGDFPKFYTLLDAKSKSTIDTHLSGGKLVLIPINKRPNYLQLFNSAKTSISTVAIVSNSDLIYSDDLLECICTAFSLQSPLSVYCLTRWNKTQNGTYLQGQVPAPPWQEITADQMELLSDVNYLSYDTYVFNKNLPIPESFSNVFIGTFGCDTAIAAIFRVCGVIVSNPCLDLRVIHIDNKPRNYSGEDGTKQVLGNVDAFKKTLTQEVANAYKDHPIMATLEQVDSNSLSIGTPTHSLGWWYCVFRMLGASPWVLSSDSPVITFEKFNIEPDTLVDSEDELSIRFENAMQKGSFLEIIVDGSNGNHYLGCFNQSDKLKEIKNQLFRYDRQYVLFEGGVDENSRRAFDKLMLFLKNQFLANNKNYSANFCSAIESGTSLPLPSEPSPVNRAILSRKDGFRSSPLDIDTVGLGSAINREYARILIIDPTPLGSNSATGQIKKTLFGHIPLTNILQVWEHTGLDPGLRIYKPSDELDPNAIPPCISEQDALSALERFSPTIVYFRSTASELLHLFHQTVVNKFDIPSIMHVMDDWEARMLWDQGNRSESSRNTLSRLLRVSMQCSQVRLSICKQMSREFARRYSCNWIDLANAVDLDSSGGRDIARRDFLSVAGVRTLSVKYMGGLAEDMNSQSIFEIANEIDRLSGEGVKVQFDIYTMDWYMAWAKQNLSRFKSVKINPLVPDDKYAETMSTADILIAAYNFDEKSIAYTKLSMANKLPEILATGRLLFAYGPAEIATIEEISSNELGVAVCMHDTELLRGQLQEVLLNDDLRMAKSKSANYYARNNYSLRQARLKVNALLGLAAAKKHKLG